MWVGGPPVITRQLVESVNAVPMPITVLLAPAPMEVTAAMGFPVARQ